MRLTSRHYDYTKKKGVLQVFFAKSQKNFQDAFLHLQPRFAWTANGVYAETDVIEGVDIENVAAVEKECRLLHRGVDAAVVKFLVQLP